MSRALLLRLAAVRSFPPRERNQVRLPTIFALGKATRAFPRAVALASLLLTIAVALAPQLGHAQEERHRRNLFGMHNLKDGGPDFVEGMEWTQHLVGRGFVFDWVSDITPWIETAFRLNLIPCIRVQEGRGGVEPDPGYAGNVAAQILNYKIAHPQYADRLVYLQLWNEPNDLRDFVRPGVYADYLVKAHAAVHGAEKAAHAAHPGLGLLGTLKTMTPGQNGPSWWEQAFAHNPDAKFAFDVWATHPYPEAAPPHYNHHDSDVFSETTKTIDSYLLDLDVVAKPHGNPARMRRGFPVMITETAYGQKLGISYEGWPKTSRTLAAAYNVDAFSQRWYRWPEILAVHPFLLANIGWDAFAWVPASSCTGPTTAGCSAKLRCSQDCDGDGIAEPTAPYPQYNAVRQIRLALEAAGMAPARLTAQRGLTGSVQGRLTRADTGAGVPYATLRTDGYAFGHVSLYDGGYELHDVPVGSYTLTVEKNGYRSTSRAITVAANQTTTADFTLVHTGKVSKGIYFIDSPPHAGCPDCDLTDRSLGQTFTVPAGVGVIKYAAAKPNIDNVTLKFSILEDGPSGRQVGPSMTATLEKGDGGIMIGGEWPDGQEPAVTPGSTYFLKVERADGQEIYCYASNTNPYSDGNAFVGGQPLFDVDLVAVLRGLTLPANSAFGNLAGTVQDNSGAAIADATITTDPGGQTTTTDAQGSYTLASVPIGSYRVSVARAGYTTASPSAVEVREGQTTTVNFTLQPNAATGSIRGTVRDASNQLLSGAQVSTGDHSVLADSTGGYALDGLTPGSYAVQATKDGYTPESRTGVVVNSGQATMLEFQLTPIVDTPAIVVNPNFEDDHGFFGVAKGWTKFGGNKWEAVWESARGFTQGVSELQPAGAGVYQTIAVTPRKMYRVVVNAKVTAAGYEAALGVDAGGGADPTLATFTAGSGSSALTPLTLTFLATGPRATIFLTGRKVQGSLNGWVQFDGVTIEATSGTGNTPPVAAISAIPNQGAPPLVVQFDGSASQDPDGDTLTYDWDFTDGTPHASLARVSHRYDAGGMFTARLTVVDGKGGSAQAQIAINVVAGIPTPSMDWDPRLDELGVQLIPANVASGIGYWKLERARFESNGEILPPPGGSNESHDTHNVYYKVLNADGAPLENRKCLASYGTPATVVPISTKGPIDAYWGDFPMFGAGWCPYYPAGPRGPYTASVADAPSDQVLGLGMPCNRHVSFRLTWRWTIKP